MSKEPSYEPSHFDVESGHHSGLSERHASAADAQPTAQVVEIYAGYLLGDRLLEQPLSGRKSRLNDNATYGARYTYHFTNQ
jgi:hypothetical protein